MECEGQEWILDMLSNVLIEVMASVAEEERVKLRQRQAEGIAAARNRGVNLGRPNIKKPENYELVMGKLSMGEITAVTAMKLLGIKRTTFYKLKKLYPIEGVV